MVIEKNALDADIASVKVGDGGQVYIDTGDANNVDPLEYNGSSNSSLIHHELQTHDLPGTQRGRARLYPPL